MNVWKVACATLVIFLAGILTGATIVRFAQAGPRPWRLQRPGGDNRVQPNQYPLANSPNPNQPNPHQPGQVPTPPPAAQTPGLLSREFIQILEHQLRLTPEQRERIGKIMAEGQENVRELRSRIDPELKKELQQTREQIRAVLTPEQRERFEQMMKRSSRRTERGEMPGQPDRRLRDTREPRNPPPVGAPVEGEPRGGQPLPPPPDR